MPTTFFKYDPSSINPNDLFPLEEIREADLEVRIRSEEVSDEDCQPVRRRELIYTSHEFRGEKIRIAAHVAIPESETPLPAMILGAGDMNAAVAFSRRHKVVTMAIDRVGTGDSNGPPDSYNQAWLDLSEDMGDGWMVQYVTNSLRAVTYLQQLPEVNPDRIGLTGSSRGGTMTLIANGVDSRIALAVPSATCGDILTAFDHDGWANQLYQHEDGSQGIPPKFRAFSIHGDPIHFGRTQHGKVMLILGAQDEYFPIYTVKTFWDAVPGGMSLCLVPDWDHGLFSADRPEVDTYDNRVEASHRMDAAMKSAIDCHLHGKAEMPATPLLSWLYLDGKLIFRATPDTAWPLEYVHLMHSSDGAYFYKRLELRKIFETFKEYYVGEMEVTAEDLQKLCFFLEAKHQDGPFLMSPPEFGLGFQQHMRQHPPRPPAMEPKFVIEVSETPVKHVRAFNQLSEGLPVLLLIAQNDVAWESVVKETEGLSRRGLYVCGFQADNDSEVERLLEELENFAPVGDHRNLHILGFGGGGTLALKCLSKRPSRFRTVVAFSPEAGAIALNAVSDDTEVRIFADLKDPNAAGIEELGEALNAGHFLVHISHPTDGLRWVNGWPAEVPVLRRAEQKYFGLFTRK
ncbi:MAG: prolyl oligopeptidase family serine peptidase [Planctomycetota bacterium]|nr:prolyl oligopeptidase family serine peptidase [Planctomycetota bacterium]MDA1140533.1 prolyl oligopeptidase family serine peptidase [Planctomycetota bacterium]